jgi:putative transcriptional regulator
MPVDVFGKLDKMFFKPHIFSMTMLRNHVKQHRARANLTQEQLGARIGVRRQTILAIEKGHYVPSTVVALKIARELGMRLDDLFQLEDRGEDAP